VVIIAIAWAWQAGAKSTFGAPTAKGFAIVSNGEVVGSVTLEQQGRHLEIDSHVEDNGRGPKTHESIYLSGTGLPQRWRISGSGETGVAIRESFTWGGGQARWRTTHDRGAISIREPRAYLAESASPFAYGLYVEALLAAPNHTLRGLPFGSIRAEPVSLEGIDLDHLVPSGHVWALWGVDVAPILVLLDGDDKFCAVLSTDRLIIPDNWLSKLGAFLTLAATLDNSMLHTLTHTVVHEWDSPIYLRNVHVFSPSSGTLSALSTVITFRGHIAEVSAADAPIPAGAVSIDGQGGTVMAALFDMHAHVSAWQGPLYIAAGITTVRDMGNDNGVLLQLMAEFDSGRIVGPGVVPSGFLEGRSPFSARGGFIVAHLPEALQSVRWYADRGYWQLKLYNSIDPSWVTPLASEAHRLGMRVAGHVPAFMSSEQAIQQGYDEITHINQLLLSLVIDPATDDTRTPLRFTALGERLAALDLHAAPFQHLLDLMQSHHTVLDPTAAILSQMLLARAGEVTPVDAPWIGHVPGPIQRSRKAAMLDIPPGESERYRASQKRMLEALRRLHEGGIRIVPGTDDSPGFMLQSELETWQRAGIEPAQILTLATLDCARYLGLDRQLGSVERGKRADLILLAGDPTRDVGELRQIRLVMKAGQVMFPEEIYESMQIEPFATKPTQ
jgi:hypothetical protein